MLHFKKFESEFLFQFSLLSLIITFLSWDKFVLQEKMLTAADWLFPVSLISPKSQFTYWLCFIGIIFGFSLAVVFRNKWAAILLPITWLCALAFEYSFGKIDHSKHCFFFLALGYLVVRGTKSIPKIVTVLIAGVTFGYLSSGLWKLRALVEKSNIWESATLNLPHHIAYGIAEGSLKNLSHLKFTMAYPNVSGFVWMSVVAFEILTPFVAILFAGKRPWILLLFLGFHLSVLFVLGINFFPQMILLVWLFVFLFQSQKIPN